MNMRRHLTLALAAILAALCCACSQQAPSPAPTATQTAESASREASAGQTEEAVAGEGETGALFGDFTATGIDGQEYTQDIFADNKLTVVNIMATWCGPCVQEMPELEKLSQEMAGEGVGVVGIVSDVWEDGETDQSAMNTAHEIQEGAGVTYPLLMPDADGIQAVLRSVQAFPTTFFVDSEGNAIAYSEGAMSLERWKESVGKALSMAEAGE